MFTTDSSNGHHGQAYPPIVLLVWQVTLCEATPIREYAATGRCRPMQQRPQYPQQPTTSGAGAIATADCVVSWFEADCGEGGWMSTAPGAVGGGRGHWMQSVQFLLQPMLLPIPVEEESQGEGPGFSGGVGPVGVGKAYRLKAKYMVDRVLLDLELAPEQRQ